MTAPTNSDAETTPSRAGVVSDACSPTSCLQCRHHAEYMTHLTATVRCRYPRERDPRVVEKTIFLHGNGVMPIKTAVICPHFEAPIRSENTEVFCDEGGERP